MKVICGIQYIKHTRGLLYICKFNPKINYLICSHKINFDEQLHFPNTDSISTNIYVVL